MASYELLDVKFDIKGDVYKVYKENKSNFTW
jgi:hypothetical protein